MGQLIVVTGPPGSGKSTVAELLVEAYDPSALVAGDAFFDFLRRGAIEPWLPASARQNEDVLAASGLAAGRLATGGRTVVFDGVLGPWLLPTFASATGLAELDYVMLLPSEARVEEQVRNRVGHDLVNLDAARKMHREFAAADVDPRHVIVDPPHEPAQTVALIRHRIGQGALRRPA